MKQLFFLPQALSALCLLACLNGCDHAPVPAGKSKDQADAVLIIKKEPTVERNSIDARPTPHAKTPHTIWFFHLMPEIAYEICDCQNTAQSVHVKLRITKVKCSLSLPINVFIADKTSPRSIEHEYGHVAICKNIYVHAADVARKAALDLLSTSYEGTGTTRDAALKEALSQAEAALGKAYRSGTVDMAERISQRFDAIEYAHVLAPLPIAAALKMAESGEAAQPEKAEPIR